MQRRLKERLIGAAVLVMLAVIFIPMILDDSTRTETAITRSNIPARPDEEFSSRVIPVIESTVPDEAPEATEPPPATAEQDPEPEKIEVEVAEEEITAEVELPVTAELTDMEDVGLTAWVVQLGSFSNEANANNLNDELRKAGFASFVEPIKQGTRVIYRVRVGPELLRSDAQKLKDQLDRKLKLETMILKYP